jgi:hypothetical protein
MGLDRFIGGRLGIGRRDRKSLGAGESRVSRRVAVGGDDSIRPVE